jgi:hypothetical protein
METEYVYCAVRTEYLYIIRFNLSLPSVHTMYLRVAYGSQNKQQLFPYTALTDWFYNFTARCELNVYIYFWLILVFKLLTDIFSQYPYL